MLVDGGPGGTAGAVESAAGRAGIKDLDLVVVSHMHADHIGATDDLVYDYDPERALIAGSCDSALGSAFAASGTKVKQVRRGDSLTVGSVKVKVLSPAGISGDENEDSLVLLLEVAGKRILLAGDLTGPNEAAVGGITARGPPLYLLKVAHHGSRYSTSSTFLDDADPQFAVICVGPNSYGHPTPDTVSRLKAEGTRIYSTQKNGTITLTIAASGAVRWQFSKTSNPVTSAGGSSGGSSDGSVTTGGSSSGSSTVYITNTGECYHRSGCQYLSQSKIPISLKDVKAQGYRACSVCDPPQ
jgi:competence protein ComEC